MAAILIIGESGSGKSASMRNLDPKNTVIIQNYPKELPFKSKFTKFSKENPDGNIFQTRVPADLIRILENAPAKGKDIIVIDDFQYMMSLELTDRAKENGYQKFTDIALNVVNVIKAASKSAANVYFLAHEEKDAQGFSKMKTVGKMLDSMITPEGLFTTVLHAGSSDGNYYFTTQSRNDVAKSPIGMFEELEVPNDLKLVDDTIRAYYK